jgi:tRNA-N(6)-(isopentenyl)adenosine-37 thiotransferase enzyme MiaB
LDLPSCDLFSRQTLELSVRRAAALLGERYDHPPTAYVHSFGCQQNASDTERIKGLLSSMGFGFADDLRGADLVLFNTCAVRESAEHRVLGNVGALKGAKRDNPDLLIVLCGCMMQQPQVAKRIRDSFPYVDIVLGTGAVHLLPKLIAKCLEEKRRVFWDRPADHPVEGIAALRGDKVKAWLPIMQGCDNFCSYCIVPYVRGREISRLPQDIEREAGEILSQGYREITLLGQNVNSYGKGLAEAIDFPALMERLDGFDGEYRLRFMTSHPKDCTRRLIDTLARSRHFCRHIHLPVQSGSDRVLRAMNRGYTVSEYLALVDYARRRIPDITFSSDIIVGFPGETREDFEQTLALIGRMRYNALFTFLYSRRSNTPAASMEDPVPHSEKSAWLRELLALQQDICCGLNRAMQGRRLRVLIDSPSKRGEGFVAGRTEGNVIVELSGPRSLIGSFADLRIIGAKSWAMTGTIV